jgi:tape measure domain-containing protein
VADSRIKITADTSQAQASIEQLNRALGGVGAASQQAEKGLGSLNSTTRLAVGAFAALTASIGLREIVNISSAYTDLNSRLVNATGSQEKARQAMAAIAKTADATYSSLEQTAEVFLRNSMSLNELGYTTSEQIKVSEVLNNALAVSATRGQAAASVLDAFAKSMSRGKIQGDDFNRIVENSPRLVQALADGLGVTTAELRNMASEGKLTSDVVIPALTSQMGKLREEAALMPATINDAFVIFRNSLVKMIADLDEATGASGRVAGALVTVARNLDLVTIAAGTFMIVLAAPKILAMARAMLVFNAAMAKNPMVLLALGAAVATTAIYEFFFANEKATDSIDDQINSIEEQAAALNRVQMAQTRLVDEQTKGLKPLFDKLQSERESIGLNQTQLAIQKNIGEAARLLKVEESAIVGVLRQKIVDKTTTLMLDRQSAAIGKIISDLQTEQLGLGIQDKNQREIALAIRRQELDFGRALNAEERSKLATTIQTTQAMREQAAIKEAISNATREQTELEKIQRGLGLQTTLGGPSGTGFVTSEKEYNRDQQALQSLLDNKIISEQVYYQQREELARQFNLKVQELEMQRIQQTMMSEMNGLNTVMSARDQATVQAVGQQERQKKIVADRINFEKKSDLEKTQFGIQQGADLFNALGAQNKKAFEAAKAFNIANAVMNTFMAATKALATYPPPFSFIAASAAVAMGLAQVAQIRSQQYSGRALGGPVMGGQTYMVGESGPELFTPATTGSITRNGDLGGDSPVNVTFNIMANDTAGFDDLLLSRRGLIRSVISDAMLESGRRG